MSKITIDVQALKDALEFEPHPAQQEILIAQEKHSNCIIQSGRKFGKTACGSEKVQMGDGSLKQLKDVVSGDEIISMSEEYKLMKDKVVAQEYCGEKEVWVVKTRTGRSIRLSASHPFYTIDGYKRTDELNVKDRIAIPRKIDMEVKHDISDTDLKLLAYTIADGGCSTGALTITKENEQIVKELYEIAEDKNWGIRKRGFHHHFNNNRKTGIKDWLNEWDLAGEHSYTKVIPPKVFHISEEKKCLFLSRLISSDGNIGVYSKAGRPRIEYCTASKELAYGLQRLLLSVGLNSLLHYRDNKCRGAYYLIISDGQVIEDFLSKIELLKPEKFLNDVREYLKRTNRWGKADTVPKNWNKRLNKSKYQVSKEYYGKPDMGTNVVNYSVNRVKLNRIADIDDNQDLKNLANSDIFWDQIVSIENTKVKEKMYDIQVEKNGNFFCQDFLVHNSILASYIAFRQTFLPKQMIWVVAPTLEVTEAMRQYMDVWAEKLNFKIHEKKKQIVNPYTKSVIQFKTADSPKTLLGMDVHLAILDEAAEIAEEIFTQRIEPNFLATKGKAVMISTPLGIENWHHQYYLRGQSEDPIWKDWCSFHFSSYANPHVSKEFLDNKKATLPKAIFESQYMANPQSGYGQTFTGVKNIVGSYKSIDACDMYINRYIAGWDIASLHDFSGLAAFDLKDKKIIEVSEPFQGDLYGHEGQLQRAYKFCIKNAVSTLYIDSSGGGANMAFQAIKRWMAAKGIYCEEFKYFGTVKAKADVYQYAINQTEKWAYEIPSHPELIRQYEQNRFKQTAQGVAMYHAPRGKHDDLLCAVLMCLYKGMDKTYVEQKKTYGEEKPTFAPIFGRA